MRSWTERLENSQWLPWLLAVGMLLVSLRMVGVDILPSHAPTAAVKSARPVLPPQPSKTVTAETVAERPVDIAMNPIDPELERSQASAHHALTSGRTPDRMSLKNLQNVHSYTYVFEGKVSQHQKPVPQASILVRITTGDRTYAQGAIADENGDYSITIPVQASTDEPVDYVMEAHDPEFRQVELVGRKISARESETVTVAKPLDLAEVQLPKKP